MEKAAPDIIVVDCGPRQAFKSIPSGQKFFDAVGNLCIKVDELNGHNSVTIEPAFEFDNVPRTCWMADLAPVRPARFS